MKLGIGIDTGGTYTDAVIYDFDSDDILGTAKALTTKENLSIGIGNALEELDKDLFNKIEVVSLSTTMATNACVENKGGRAKLLLIGVNKKVVDWVGKDYGIKDNGEIYFCDEMCNFDGTTLKEPDWYTLLNDTKDWLKDSEGLGIVEIYAMKNGAYYEKKAKEEFSKNYDFPIVCGHELFSELNSIQRGSSTLLNAKLIPIINDFTDSIKSALTKRGINAPAFIVRSDSTLMSEEFFKIRPVETILCGPASSVLGGMKLTNEKNSIIVDMGGTTTDISLIKDSVPVKVKDGVSIGKWRTFVKGIFIDTFGLGGDSAIRAKDDNLNLETFRVMPICVAASKWPSITEDLKALLKSNRRNSYPLHEFLCLVKEINNTGKYTKEELALCNALKQRPLILSDAAKCISKDVYMLDTKRLEKEGIIIRCGLTPTDIMHIKGDFNTYNTEASKLAAQFVMEYVDKYSIETDLSALCDDVYDMVKKTLYLNIVRIFLQDKYPKLKTNGIDKQLEDLIIKNWELIKRGKPSEFFEISFTTKATLTCIGAPTHIFLPDVAKALNTKCVIPENAAVANAIGAIVGNVAVTSCIEIKPNYSTEGTSKYTVYSKSKKINVSELEEAIEIAKNQAILEAKTEAQKRIGAKKIDVTTKVISNTAYAKYKMQIDLGTKVIATAVCGL